MFFRRRSRRSDDLPDLATVAEVVDRDVALARRLGEQRHGRLIELTDELVRTRSWEAAEGFELTHAMCVTVAANAAFPILAFDTWPYRQVTAVVLRPTSVSSRIERSGPAGGTYTDERMHLAGEAMPHSGPIALAWDAVLHESRHPLGGSNVVIHEFAHKIDMNDGYSDGVPPLRGEALDRWLAMLDLEFAEAGSRESDAVLRPYAWSSPAEFFAVSTETFFCRPRVLAEHKPEVYDLLRILYQQDPVTESR